MMFKKTLIPFILILSFSINGQKKELKEVDKLVKIEDYDTALNQLLSIKPIVENSELKYKAQYHFLAGKIYGALKDFESSFAAFKEAKKIELDIGSSKFTSEINGLIIKFSNDVINKAIEERDNNNFTEAADLLYLVYNVDKEKNLDYLYYSANNARRADDLDRAVKYYEKLRNLNYTGSVEKFYATDNESGEEIEISAENYILFKNQKSYSNFRTEMTKSLLPEIIKSIVFIYRDQKKYDLALNSIKDARLLDPSDVNLILIEAELYLNLGEKNKFVDLTKEAIEKDPNNHFLPYNLGIISAEQGDIEKAKSFFEKAIELNPLFINAHSFLAEVMLTRDNELVEKMNSLGLSPADDIKYKQLQNQREEMFIEVIPIYEKILEIDSLNKDALRMLKNIYEIIGDSTNYNKYNDRFEALGQ